MVTTQISTRQSYVMDMHLAQFVGNGRDAVPT